MIGNRRAILSTPAGNYEPETKALIGAMALKPSATRKTAINTLVRSLKAAAVWSKLSVLHVYAAHSAQAANLNWIKPASGPTAAIQGGSPVFTPDKGWSTDGAASFLTTGWTPSTDATFALNAATVGYWSNQQTTGQGNGGGVYDSGPSVIIGMSGVATPAYNITINTANGTSTWSTGNTTGNTVGVTAVTRADANTVKLYNGGALALTNAANASTSKPAKPYWIGAQNVGGSPFYYAITSYGAFFAGGLLVDADHAALSAALTAYMQAIGNIGTPLVGWGDSLSNGSWYNGAMKQADATARTARFTVSQGNSGETSAQIATRMLADTLYVNDVQVIWAGRNDISNAAQTVNSSSILSNVASMVAAAQARSGKYIVISVTNANIGNPRGSLGYTNSEASGTTIYNAVIAVNNTLASLYGSHYLDLRSLIVAQGAFGDSNDQADRLLDVPPRNLMADQVHFGSIAYSPYTFSGVEFNGRQIELKLESLGY